MLVLFIDFLDTSTHLYIWVCPSVSPSVGQSVGFFQTADFEWKRHINHRISIEFEVQNITCPLTIEKKTFKKIHYLA